MRIGKSFEEMKNYNKWSKWFAWYPVLLDGGRWAWLERVWKRVTYYGTDKQRDYYALERFQK